MPTTQFKRASYSQRTYSSHIATAVGSPFQYTFLSFHGAIT